MPKKVTAARAGGKTSMRTAEDVIKRIRWDPDINQGDFAIGYIDRFKGIVEDPFVGFNWEDVVQHRIQYFRYRGVIVWDKRIKLDHVFGSLGGPSLQELNLEPKEDRSQPEDEGEGDGAAGAMVADEEKEDKDSDDDGSGSAESKAQTASRALPAYPPTFIKVADRPNYFVCLRITNKALTSALAELQQVFTSLDPRLTPGVVPPSAFHITLGAFQLKNTMEHERAIALMKQCGEVFRTFAARCKAIEFKGIHCFRDRVIYANPVDPNGLLDDMQNAIIEIFEDNGFLNHSPAPFTPHVTLIKLNRAMTREMRFIDRSLYLPFASKYLGTQVPGDIHLCSMRAPRQPSTGFYLTLASECSLTVAPSVPAASVGLAMRFAAGNFTPNDAWPAGVREPRLAKLRVPIPAVSMPRLLRQVSEAAQRQLCSPEEKTSLKASILSGNPDTLRFVERDLARMLQSAEEAKDATKAKEFEEGKDSRKAEPPVVNDGSRTVVILRGLPGSGKSSIINSIQTQWTAPLVVCSADQYFLDEEGVYNFSKTKLGEAHDFCFKKFFTALENKDQCVVVDNTNTQIWEYARYLELADAFGYRAEVVEIACPDATWLETFASRNAHDVSQKKATAMWKRWEYDPLAKVVPPFSSTGEAVATEGVCGGGALVDIPGKRKKGRRNIGSGQRHSAGIFTGSIPTPEPAVSLPESFCIACVMLSPDSRRKLLRCVPPKHSDIHADHVTIAFKPTVAQAEQWKRYLGQNVAIAVTGIASDEKAQAVTVDIDPASCPASKNKHPHITLSVAKYSQPVWSNTLLENTPAMPLDQYRKEVGIAVQESVDLMLEGVFVVRYSWSSKGFLTSPEALDRYLGREALEIKEDEDAFHGPIGAEESKETAALSRIPQPMSPVKKVWVFFDFDSTLCRTLAKGGVSAWQRETKCAWSFPEWLIHPGSLLLRDAVRPGPALRYFQQYAGAVNCQVAILTARSESVEPALRYLLSDARLFPHPPANPIRFLCKPMNDPRPNPTYKANAVLKTLQAEEAAKRVVLFEDQEDALEAMQHILSRNGFHPECHLVDPDAREWSGMPKDGVSQFLADRGALRGANFTLCAWSAIDIVNKAWLSCLEALGVPVASKATGTLLGFLHGSFLLGKSYCDVDMCLLSHASPLESLEALARELAGVGEVYLGKSQRCPRLAVRLYPIPGTELLPIPLPEIEVDITIAPVSKEALSKALESPVVDKSSHRAAVAVWKGLQVPFLASEIGREASEAVLCNPLPALDINAITSSGMLSADAIRALQAPSLTRTVLRNLGFEEKPRTEDPLEDVVVLLSLGQWLDTLSILLSVNQSGGAMFHGPRKFDILEAAIPLIARGNVRVRSAISDQRLPTVDAFALEGAPLPLVVDTLAQSTRPSYFMREFLRGLQRMTVQQWEHQCGRRVPKHMLPQFVSVWSSLLETARELMQTQDTEVPGCLCASSAQRFMQPVVTFPLANVVPVVMWINSERPSWHVDHLVSSLVGVCIRRLSDASIDAQPGFQLPPLGGVSQGGVVFGVRSTASVSSLKRALTPILEEIGSLFRHNCPSNLPVELKVQLLPEGCSLVELFSYGLITARASSNFSLPLSSGLFYSRVRPVNSGAWDGATAANLPAKIMAMGDRLLDVVATSSHRKPGRSKEEFKSPSGTPILSKASVPDLLQLVRDFGSSDASLGQDLLLPPGLAPSQRAALHEEARTLGLGHETVFVEGEKRLKLWKPLE